MKINQEMKRKIVQVAAFGYSNTYIGNFVSGQIYKEAGNSSAIPE